MPPGADILVPRFPRFSGKGEAVSDPADDNDPEGTVKAGYQILQHHIERMWTNLYQLEDRGDVTDTEIREHRVDGNLIELSKSLREIEQTTWTLHDGKGPAHSTAGHPATQEPITSRVYIVCRSG